MMPVAIIASKMTALHLAGAKYDDDVHQRCYVNNVTTTSVA